MAKTETTILYIITASHFKLFCFIIKPVHYFASGTGKMQPISYVSFLAETVKETSHYEI